MAEIPSLTNYTIQKPRFTCETCVYDPIRNLLLIPLHYEIGQFHSHANIAKAILAFAYILVSASRPFEDLIVATLFKQWSNLVGERPLLKYEFIQCLCIVSEMDSTPMLNRGHYLKNRFSIS